MKLWVKIALAAGLLLICLGAAVLGGVYWWFSEEESRWSSESSEARAELEAGYRDFEKAYYADAALHFERARELDPKSAAALVFLAFVTLEGDSEREAIRKQVDELDSKRFTDFERFLVRLLKAGSKHGGPEVGAAVEDFLSLHPDDPFVRNMRCELFWEAKKWDEAETCYRALLKEQPQWVQAQDRLGLLAMSRGRFAEAEDHFVTYKYVAPNQPAPHSSIGILFMITGRYEEAEQSFRRALEIKRDYCQALSGLTHLYTVWGKYAAAIEVIELTEGQAACRFQLVNGFTCSRRLFNAYLQNDEAKARELDQACPAPMGYTLGKHQVAVWFGEFERAEAMEAAASKAAVDDPEKQVVPFLAGYSHYLRGVRLIGQERYPEAADEFAAADGELRYWTGDNAILSCVNDVHHVYALELAGRDQEAKALRQRLAAVNPRLVESFKIPVLEAKLAARKRR